MLPHAPLQDTAVGFVLLCLALQACGKSELDVIVRVDDTSAAATTAPPPSAVPTGVVATAPDAGVAEPPDAAVVAPPPAPDIPPPTPIVTAQPSLPVPTDAGLLPIADAGECQTVGGVVLGERVRFFLKADDRCLDIGPPVTLVGVRTNYVRAGDEWCDLSGSLWQLIHSREGSFEVRNSLTNYNLEIEGAGSDIGDLAVLFRLHEFDHQRFLIRDRGQGYAALSPLHQPALCLSASSAGWVSLAACVAGEPTQEWFLEEEGCAPDAAVPPPSATPDPASSGP